MKILFSALLILLFVCCLNARGDDAPVVNAGIVLNAPLTPINTAVPLTVSNFIDIGSFILSLDYDSTVVQYSGFTPDSIFTGLSVVVSTPGGIYKRLTINWPAGGTGITLPDQCVLLNITFKYKTIGSRSTLTWYNNGATCQFTKYAGGSYTVLNDQPTATFYFNGVVTDHAAPYTTAPLVTGAIPGQVAVPVLVSNFYNIGSITLTLIYDPDVLTYQTFTQNGSIPGTFSVGSNTHPVTGVTTINMGWFGEPFALADSSTLLTLFFNYSNATEGNFSELTWSVSPNAACEYSDGQYRLLYDGQSDIFYTNGLVASQLAPQTWLPSFITSSPSDNLPVLVKVSDFTGISSFALSFKYDPAVVTYDSAEPNSAFNGLLNVVNNPVAPDGTRTLSLSWTGASPLTLPDISSVVTLFFTYNSGTTTLSWIIDDSTSCRFNDSAGYAFYDKPKTTYYREGLAASHLAPRTAAWYSTPDTGQMVTVPVMVFEYSDIGFFSLTLDYDPGALTYLNASLVPAIGGTFTLTSPGPGRIIMDWTGNTASLADSTTLINLTFNYNGGESALAWFSNGISCRYAESSTSSNLYDHPQAIYYINGYVGPNPLLVNFLASTTELPDTIPIPVSLIDLSSGDPSSWHWAIDPPNADFINGTTPSSQNPQVSFTANGVYTVTLIENRGPVAGIKARSNYIYVGIPGLWTGNISSDWQTASNWHNYMVPGPEIDVVIPSEALNWPVFIGNFILGTQCRTLKLEGGGNCTMTIREN